MFTPPGACQPTPAPGHSCRILPRWSRLSCCPWVVGRSFCYRWLQNGDFLSLHRYFLCICCLKTAACCRFLLRAAVPSANSWHFWAAPGERGYEGPPTGGKVRAYHRQRRRTPPPKAVAYADSLITHRFDTFWDTFVHVNLCSANFATNNNRPKATHCKIDCPCGIIKATGARPTLPWLSSHLIFPMPLDRRNSYAQLGGNFFLCVPCGFEFP